jgi:hypothetical protein
MSKSFTFRFDGLDKAIGALETFKPSQSKFDALMGELCEIGAKALREAYSDTTGTGENAASVTWKKEIGSYIISANSDHLLYLEFGAGIAKNGEEPYPIPRPAGVGGIGSQGKGLGKRQGWWYPDAGSPTGYKFTRGTKARSGFPKAYNAMVAALPGLVGKYFK